MSDASKKPTARMIAIDLTDVRIVSPFSDHPYLAHLADNVGNDEANRAAAQALTDLSNAAAQSMRERSPVSVVDTADVVIVIELLLSIAATSARAAVTDVAPDAEA
jgi:hypothetical protein